MKAQRYERKERKGCGRKLAIGCGTLVILAIVAAIGGYAYVNHLVNRYTSTTPGYVPDTEVSNEQARSLYDRVDRFAEGLEKGTATEPLVLSADDINYLIASDPDFGALHGKTYVQIEGDTLRADFSLPLDQLVPLGEGRYLNGTAAVQVGLVGGRPVIRISSMETNGEKVPERLVEAIERSFPIDKVASNPDVASALGKLESVEVRDGKIVITPK